MKTKAKILLIEDDEDTATAMKLTLEAQYSSVILTDEPEKGFLKAKQDKPDLIILDVMFGEKEEKQGFEYAMRMKRDKGLASIPILMVTAVNVSYPSFHFSPKTDGEYLPVDDFIDKPAQPDELLQKVKNLLKQGISKWVNWPNPSA